MDQVWSVSDINQKIKELIAGEGTFAHVEVEGEISNFKKYPSGHCYFNLKDEKSSLKAVMFAGYARYLKEIPHNGDKVLALGRLDVYERDGVYQLYTEMLLPQGTGALMLAYEQLKKKLELEGLFAVERKKQLPVEPKAIGLVTSSAGAAVRDIIKVVRKRNPGVKLILYPVRVQGEQASQEIAKGIAFFNKHKLVDMLIVGRGGGSKEDLWAFNEEITVRAIAASQLPLISAVGHEIDFTLADFASDVRAATPSAAAEIAVTDRQAVKQRVGVLQTRLHRGLRNMRLLRLQRWEKIKASWIFKDPLRIWENKAQAVDNLGQGLRASTEELLSLKKQQLALAKIKLEALSPLAVLARGYTITTDAKGEIIKNSKGLKAGAIIATRWDQGMVRSQVLEGSRDDDGQENHEL